jgi:O-antigen/teichoic acid export membrane protein
MRFPFPFLLSLISYHLPPLLATSYQLLPVPYQQSPLFHFSRFQFKFCTNRKPLKKLLRDFIFTAGTEGVLLILGTLLGILMARSLGPEGKGIYGVVILVPSMIMSFVSLNIGPANIYMVGKKLFPMEAVLSNTMFMVFAFSLPSIAGFWLLYPVLRDNMLRIAPVNLLIFAVSIMPVYFFNAYMQSLLLALKKVDRYNFIRIVNVVFDLFLFGIFFWAGKLDVSSAVIIYLSGVLLVGGMLFWEVHKISPLWPKWSAPIARLSLGYGTRSYLTGLVETLNKRGDIFILAALATVADVGFYSIAVNLADILWMMTNSLSTLLFPHVSALNNEESSRQSALLCRNSLILSLPVVLIWGVVGSFALPILYSSVYTPAIPLFQWLLPGVWIFTIVKVLSGYLSGIGKPELNIIPHGMAVIADVLMIFLLFPAFGVVGIAIASTIAYTISAIIILIIFSSKSHIKWYRVLFIQPEDLSYYRKAYQAVRLRAMVYIGSKAGG